MTQRSEPSGIGGWLIFPMLNTVVSPLSSLMGIVEILPLLGNDMPSGVGITLISKLIFSLFMMIAWIVAAIHLFKHKRSFPSFFIVLLLIELLGGLIIVVITVGVFNAAPMAGDHTDLVDSFLALIIFGPYMARSKRVRNTFTGKPHANEENSREWSDADKEAFSWARRRETATMACKLSIFDISRNVRTKQSIRLWATLLSCAVLPIPAGIAAWRGIKWGVATITAVGVIGLAGLGIVSARFVFAALDAGDFWRWLAILTLAAFIFWLGGRHLSVVLPYLTAGDRSLLFFEYGRGTAISLGVWHSFRTAPRNKRVKGLTWMFSALPAGAAAYLALRLILWMVISYVPKIAIPLVEKLDELLSSNVFVIFVVFGVAYGPFRRGLQHIAPSARAIRHEDQRPPILMLRSFSDEDVSIPGVWRNRGLFFLFFLYLPKRLDELLEQSLRSYGPVIAIGRPKEALPSLGAAREYASDADWMSLVEARLREAQIVVAILGDTEGFVWEMSAIFRLSLTQRLIVVMPQRLTARQKSDRWRRISKVLDLEPELPTNAVAVSWDDSKMNVVTAGELYVETYRMALALLCSKRAGKSIPERGAASGGP
jgi:hypothetical protein